jgi:hypothetical protein
MTIQHYLVGLMPNTMSVTRQSLADKFQGVIDAYTRIPEHNAPT